MFDEEQQYIASKLQTNSLLKFAFEQGFLRLGSDVALAILLIFLLRKTTLTEFELVSALVIGPIIGFLCCCFVWFVKRYIPQLTK